MAKNKDAQVTIARKGPFHPAPGEASEISVYKDSASHIAPYVQELAKTGTCFQMYQLLIGQELWQIRNRGRGCLAAFIKLAKTGGVGVRMTKWRIDTALSKFDRCMKAIGYKTKQLPKLLDAQNHEQLNLALWEKGPPENADERWKRMYEWCQQEADATDKDMDGDGTTTFGGKLGNENATKLTPEEAREAHERAMCEELTRLQEWIQGDPFHSVDEHGNRPTLEDVQDLEPHAFTLFALPAESLAAFEDLCAKAAETAKYIRLLTSGVKVVKRKAKGGKP